MPRTSLYTVFSVKGAGREVPQKVNLTTAITVDEIEFDAEIPATAFWPEHRDEVRVFDSIRPKAVHAPMHKEATLPVDVIRVAEPRGVPWTLLGGALLVAALIATVVALRLRGSPGGARRRPA